MPALAIGIPVENDGAIDFCIVWWIPAISNGFFPINGGAR
jgi:hypothetical protein